MSRRERDTRKEEEGRERAREGGSCVLTLLDGPQCCDDLITMYYNSRPRGVHCIDVSVSSFISEGVSIQEPAESGNTGL